MPHISLKILALFATCATLSTVSTTDAQVLKTTQFSNSQITPSPSCLSVAANGDVFVGVDLLGSLGKGANRGHIVKLSDHNNDGQADTHTIFAKVDNPRGILAIGDTVYVLHTHIPNDTGLMEGMYLSAFTDKDKDGYADGPPRVLVKRLSTLKHNRERGADHSTNGIRMGIDGWIYLAVGDFGFIDAEGADGTQLSMLGGGIIRVRPDGNEMELYTTGMRNIYDLAIDPFMNIFTRGNTNDGGGWWIRFSDHIQTGKYGYPTLFKHFTDEIIPALCDLGPGSGSGALFLDEPTWPEAYNKQALMADWGNNLIYLHRTHADGPTFTQSAEELINAPQPTDLDIDTSGQLFIAAWDGAGYKGSTKRGQILRVTPPNWTPQAFPKLSQLKSATLVEMLNSKSAKTRLAVQQELLSRPHHTISTEQILKIVKDENSELEARIAALFTFAQITKQEGQQALVELTSDPSIREWALRALTDRAPIAYTAPMEPFLAGLQDANQRVQLAALIGLGRIGNPSAAAAILPLTQAPQRDYTPLSNTPPLFESPELKGTGSTTFAFPLNGAATLALHAAKGKDNGGDHLGWFDLTLTTADGNTLDLTTLSFDARSEWGKTAVGRSCTGAPLARKDGKAFTSGIGTHAESTIVFHIPPKFRTARLTGSAAITSTADGYTNVRAIISTSDTHNTAPAEGPHATPNPDIIVPHIAVNTLVKLNATDACLAAIDSPNQDGALWALRLMHSEKAVDGIIGKLHTTTDHALKTKLIDTLTRLYSKEAPYKGSWWWGPQPDTSGPYYKPITWSASPKIAAACQQAFAQATTAQAQLWTRIAKKNKAHIPGINDKSSTQDSAKQTVGDTSIEDLILAFENHTPDLANGKEILLQKSCIGCHSIEPLHSKKGPDLNHIGKTLNREEIAAAIIQPDATIAHNWVDVKTTAGTTISGTLVSKSDTSIVVRSISGKQTTLPAHKVTSIQKSSSTLMGPHLLDSLTIQEFVDAVEYLANKK